MGFVHFCDFFCLLFNYNKFIYAVKAKWLHLVFNELICENDVLGFVCTISSVL